MLDGADMMDGYLLGRVTVCQQFDVNTHRCKVL